MKSSACVVAAALLGLSPAAMAHVPRIERSDSSEAQPHQITTALEKSIAIYAGLHESDNVDVYQFTITAEDLANGSNKIHTGTLTPRCEAYRSFTQSVYLLGPEQQALPAPTEEILSHILVTVPHTYGAIEVPQEELDDRDETSYYEKFAGTWYWWEHKTDVYVDRPGVYWLVVQANDATSGDYVLEFGDQEHWTAADIARTLVILPWLRQHREIHDASCRDEQRHQE